MAISKNQRSGRGLGNKVRQLDGVEVKPVKYHGKGAGHGIYMTGEVNGNLVCDAKGKPIPLKSIGKVDYLPD